MSNLGHLIMQTDHKHKSRTHNDGIYSKLNSQPRICISMLRICILLPMFTPCGLVINMEEMPPCFVLGVFLWSLCIIRWAKSGSYLHNNNIWVLFLDKIWVFDPRVTIYKVTLYCLAIHFEGIPSCFVIDIFFVVTLHYQMVQIGKLFAFYQYLR